MVHIEIARAASKSPQPKTMVVFVRKSGNKTEAIGADRDMAPVLASIEEDGLTHGDLKKGLFLRSVGENQNQNVLFVGIDEKTKTLEDVRKLAATVCQCLKANKVREASVIVDGLMKSFKDVSGVAQAYAEGTLLAAREFETFKTKKSDKDDNGKGETAAKSKKEIKLEKLHLVLDKKTNAANFNKGLEVGRTLAEVVNLARDLGDTPGNLMTPEKLANAAVEHAKGTKLKVTVWDKARIKKERMGGLLGVSLGSAVDPRFIILEYNGGAKSKKPVCFVGKGLTFDSGGISIKPSGGMEEMKFDKCGGVNVICTLLAIARLKLKINAIGLVPATENMPGPLANKPGDILVARNGKTVEVDNTDAEGRLILMDALSYASELKPAAIFDAATLTGACVVALGNTHTGVFTRDEKVRKNVSEAADVSGEWVWAMPICDHHVTDMKGTYADLNNISSFKGAGASTAAAFLEQFVDKDIPWAHFDIAGTGWHVGNRLNYCARKGASGVMIRTFVELAKIYS
jgi:leucyl aminopeptidase